MAGRNPFPSAWGRRGSFSSMQVHVLSLSPFRKSRDSALTPSPTKTEACPSSWSPSLLAPSARVGVLILFSTDEAPRSSPAACSTTEPRSPRVLSNAPERGWTRRPPTPLLGSWRALSIFGRRWGGPSPFLAPCLACLPGGPMVLVPLWHHQGNAMFHCCDTWFTKKQAGLMNSSTTS